MIDNPFWVRFVTNNDEQPGGTDQGTKETEQDNKDTETNHDDGEENTPQSVDQWRKYSRKWERRAKDSQASLEKAQADFEEQRTKFKQAEKDLEDTRARLEKAPTVDDLNQLADERDNALNTRDLVLTLARIGADVPALTDSISFMDKATTLDAHDDGYEDAIKDLVKKHSGRLQKAGTLYDEEPGGKLGVSLWDRLHKKEN